MSDEMIERDLDSYGFAEVLVTMAPSAAATTVAAKTEMGASVLGNFLDCMPTAAGGEAAAMDSRSTARAVPAARQFPRLGVALGYVDRAALRTLEQNPSVATVHAAEPLSLIRPVAARTARATAGITWGLLHFKVKKLWDQGLTGKGVRVGHLDTGVDGKHPALKGRVVDFLEVDLNGERVAGAKPYDSDKTFGHGTHTAGTICGGKVQNLSIGVAPEADLYSGLVIEGGQVLLRVLQGMEWALEKNVRVLNMSLGFRGHSPFFLDVTQRLRDEGVLPVFAIGNEGVGTSRSPGNYSQSLSVGAHDRQGQVADFSSSITFNRPEEPNQPNVVAPGVSIVSAKPGGGVRTLDGTSMATPHVAGLAALLFQAKPNASVSQVEQAIQSTCVPLPKVDPLRFGFGQVDPVAALAAL